MNIFKFITIGFFALILSSCVFPSGSGYDFETIIQASEEDEGNDFSDRRRGNRPRKRSGNRCATYECQDICEDIYDDDEDGVIERCLELSEETLYTFDTIIDYLSDPTLKNVRTVREEYRNEFEDLVDVSLEPWVDITESVNQDEAEALLIFVASSEAIAEALMEASKNYEGYKKYEGIKTLLDESVGSSRSTEGQGDNNGNSCLKYHYALCCEKLSDGDYRFNNVASAESRSALIIIDEILEAECSGNSDVNGCAVQGVSCG